MSDVQAPSQAAGLFQKAHGRIVMLQRIDAQIASLLSQRRKVQSELHDAQAEINDEFTRLMNQSDELPASVLAEISGSTRRSDNNAPEASGSRMDMSESIP